MANHSHNMLWNVQLVKQEEDPFPIIHEFSSRSFSIFENWDLDLVVQQPVFANDPNILLLDDPYWPLEMLPESSFIPDYSLNNMEFDPINSFFGCEDYICGQMDHLQSITFNDDSDNMAMNNNNEVLQQKQMPLMSGVCSHETLAIPPDESAVWLDKLVDEDNNIIDTTGRRGMVRRAGAKRSRGDNYYKEEDIDNYSKAITLSREAISEYFYMPITQAAKEMKIGLTLLKKRCREVGIRRWPHRKLMSLQTLINNVQETGDDEEMEEKNKVVVEMLTNEMKLMEQVPDRELGENTKKLRQACFKANYKKRKLLISSSPSS